MDPTPKTQEPSTSEVAHDVSQSSGDTSIHLSFQLIINIVFIILGLPSNILAMFVMWKRAESSLSTVSVFLLNLALADSLVLTVYIPFSVAYEALDFEWPFGSFLCKFVFSLSHLCMYASLATLTTIAVERYLLTFHNLIRKYLVKYVVVGIWVGAIFLSIPQLVFLKLVKINNFDYEDDEAFDEEEGDKADKYVCDLIWPHPILERIFQPLDLVLLYLIPLAFVAVLYFKIICKLRAVDKNHLSSARLVYVKQRKRAVHKMMIVVAVFALCHLPIHVFHLVRVFFYEYWEELVLESPWLFSLFVNLVLVTHVINPWVYGSLHRCFKVSVVAEMLRFHCRCGFIAKGRFFRSVIRRSNTQQTVVKYKHSTV